MRTFALSMFALVPLSGCLTLHADLPEDAVRLHMAQEEGLELSAVCSHDGKRFSEGAVACMAGGRMSCDPAGRWVRDGDC